MHPALPLIAQVARIDAASLRPEQTLADLNIKQSLGLALLRSALERKFQRKLPGMNWQTSIGNLLAAIDGTGELPAAGSATPARAEIPRAAAEAAPINGPASTGLGHGIDVQEVAALPELAHGWEQHPFYAGHFTAEELAAARGKPDLRAHLTGLWCAKEAVKKADPELLPLAFIDLAIVHDAHGRPFVKLADARLRDRIEIVVSISHSSAYAFGSAITRRR